MRKLLIQIWNDLKTFLKKIHSLFAKKEPIKVLNDEEGLPKQIDLKTLLNTFYLHPEIIRSMPYEMLYSDIFDEIGQMLSSLENQWHQNEIDYALGYVTLDRYCEKRISMQERFEEYKVRYLQAMNLA